MEVMISETYRVEDIITSFGIFLDDEVEAEDEYEAKELVLNEIIDNIGNYIEIEVEELQNGSDDNE